MKKSIFLIFAAILCAMSVSAKVIYFKPNSNWAAANAHFYAHVWGGEGATSPVKFTPVATDPDVYEAEVGTHTSIIFLRHDPAKTDAQVESDMWNLWNRMGNLSIPTEGENCCTINDGEWSQEKDDASSHVTWSTYTPPTEVVIPDRYITGTIAGGWNGNEVKMTYDEVTETYSHTFTAVAADEPHQFKVTDGTWSKNWGGDAVSPAIEGVTTGSDGNVAFTLSVGGDVTITFKDSKIQLTTTGSFTPVETFDYYVVGSFNGWNTADAAYGMTKDGDVYKKEVTFAAAVEFKVCDGTWGAAWGANNLGDTKYLELEGADNIVMKEEKTFTVIFNPTENLITFDGLTVDVDAVTYDYYVIGTVNGWAAKDENYGMTDENADGVYEKEVTLAVGDNEIKVNNGTWDDGCHWGFSNLSATYEGVEEGKDGEGNPNGNIKITLATQQTITVKFDKNTSKITLDGLTEKAPVVLEHDYYITGSFNENNPADEEHGMTLDETVYKATVTLAEGDNTLKVTDGTWDNTWGANELGAAYEEVSNPNDYNNIKITLAAEKEITVIFDATAGKITFEGLTEKAPAEDVTVYFINSGEWAEVACHYWGGLNGSEWPGVQMDLTAETYEAEGWNVYKVTFPGDNTSCIFNDNKAEGAKQTGNLEVHDGQYYCYENGIWYERLADVDPLDTRVYLKGDMNEWCNNGWCDMFRKENVSETVAYITTWLEANTTYEFKIESAGAWLSNTGTMEKDNCTGWTFEESVNDNAKITTEYAGDYTFIWDMTTNKLSVEYPDPKANPSVLDLMVTNMVFDGETLTFSGSDNTYGIALNLVVGDMIDEEVYALDASSTVDFGGTLFTDVTGTITPDMIMGIATAVVYGFFDGTYFQLNVDMSAGGGTLVEIWDGVATPNDGTGELTISANWDGDDVYVVVPGFDYTNYECPEVWFYIGGITWETADIAAFGPATITVEDGGVLVEGSVISGATGAQYELMVFGLLPVEETPDYTRTVTAGNFGTLCLPFGGEITGAVLYEVVGSEPGKVYLGSVTTLEAGVPYIFQATATELAVYSDGTNAPASHQNGLHGTFDDETVVDAGNYILLNNELRPSDGTAKVNANRAYLVMSEITGGAPQQMPGRRYIGMSVQGENETTGVEDIFTTDTPVKLIENGQLIIIRGNEKFNAQGVRL